MYQSLVAQAKNDSEDQFPTPTIANTPWNPKGASAQSQGEKNLQPDRWVKQGWMEGM